MSQVVRISCALREKGNIQAQDLLSLGKKQKQSEEKEETEMEEEKEEETKVVSYEIGYRN